MQGKREMMAVRLLVCAAISCSFPISHQGIPDGKQGTQEDAPVHPFVPSRRTPFQGLLRAQETVGQALMAILNAIMNKVILRAAAVVNKKKKYVDNYKKAA